MKEEGKTVPEWVLKHIEKGNESFYQNENGNVYFYDQGTYKQQNFNKKEINLKRLKDVNGVIKKNTGASLIDLGDGVAGLEFHSQSNAIGLDIIQMINYANDEIGRASCRESKEISAAAVTVREKEK